ncbi:MAG: hypothetical protein UZ16_OP3001000769 [Candidatus Hinthialibacteria bacterium OLB16]|nr:MAG: hypothetical protein UZ16_OP3001000769 [Candidatus Hinthialibacteria bacterium OLB16]
MMLSFRDLFAGCDDRFPFLLIEDSELHVGQRAGLLDLCESANLGSVKPAAADLKVVDRALCVNSVKGISGNLKLSE